MTIYSLDFFMAAFQALH